MTAPFLFFPVFRAFTAAGLPAAGYLLHTYAPGTTNPQATYSDAAGTVPNTNPVVLDTTGSATIRLNSGLVYDFVLKDPTDTTTIWSEPSYYLPISVPSTATAAEIAAGVTPTNLGYAAGNVLRYGADPTGVADSTTAFNKATLVCKQAAGTYNAGLGAQLTGGIEMYIPAGSYTLTTTGSGSAWNLTSNVGGGGSNNGIKIRGDGTNSTIIVILATVSHVGVGIDMTGASYMQMDGIHVAFGQNDANAPKVGVLMGASLDGGSNFIFSGSNSFPNCFFGGFAQYTIYNLGAEQLSFHDSAVAAQSSGAICAICHSGPNTAGITSPNVTLVSPAHSMTAVDFTGYRGQLLSNGQYVVYYDLGSTGVGPGGLASHSFENTYINMTSAACIAFFANGGAGSIFTNFSARNIQVEFNNATRNQQIFKIIAATISEISFDGLSSSPATATAILFQFSTTVTGAFINWNPNSFPGAGYSGSSMVFSSAAYNGVVMGPLTAAQLLVNGSANSNSLVIGTDFQVITHTNISNCSLVAASSDATTYQLAAFVAGSGTGGNEVGGIYRRTNVSVNNVASVILSGVSFGARVTVAGVSGGTIFHDELSCAYNAFAVINSLSAQGSPPARTYSVANNGTLLLALASGTATVTVTSTQSGARGA